MSKNVGMRAGKEIRVEVYLRGFPKTIQALINSLRKLIKHVEPDVIERVYPGWKLIGYRARRGRDTHYVGFLAPFEDRLVLGFEYGTMLSDQHKILKGSGTQVQQVVIRNKKEFKKSILLPLIVEAVSIATEWKK